MAKEHPSYRTNIEAFRSILELMRNVRITPSDLAQHWLYSPTYLATLRSRGEGIPHHQLETGRVFYSQADVIGSELQGTSGPLTADRVCLAVAACEAIPLEARAVLVERLQKEFGIWPRPKSRFPRGPVLLP